MMVPKGISLKGSAFPISGATPAPEDTSCPTCKPFGAITYLFSPSAYTNNAIKAVLFGSYWIESTVAATPCLSLLKSITRYLLLWPPPFWRMVIFPWLFLPPDFFNGASKLFSGLSAVMASNPFTTLKRCPGVIGFNFLTDISCLYRLL